MSHPASIAGAALLERMSGLFEKRFVVSAVIPVVVFSTVNLSLAASLGAVDVGALWVFLVTDLELVSVFGILVILWLLALGLMDANHLIIRCLEGYLPGILKPFSNWGRSDERQKFRELCREIEAARPGSLERRSLQRHRATRFPPREEELLPTAFGNVVRAFESYAPEVYCLESTRGWTRLLAVVPREFWEVVDEARSQVDFLAHMWAVSCTLVAEYFALWAWTGRPPERWFLVGAVLAIPLFAWRARHAAMRWGEAVKGCFDAFLPDLRCQLGLPRPRTRDDERRMWAQFSETFLTADHQWLPPLGVTPDPTTDPEERRGKQRKSKHHLRSV